MATLLFSILAGMVHVHIHHNFLIRSLTHVGNPGIQAQYRDGLAAARAAGYTQSYCCQDRASSNIRRHVGLDTKTVRDRMTPDTVILRSPAEGHLDTGKVVQGP
jgi:hypothetical protein